MSNEIDKETVGRFLGALRIFITCDEAARILQAADLVPAQRLRDAETRAEEGLAQEKRLYDALWTTFNHARLYMTLSENVEQEALEALAQMPNDSTPDWKARAERLEAALRRIVDEIPPNEHWKWKHHHHYLCIAREALAQQDAIDTQEVQA